MIIDIVDTLSASFKLFPTVQLSEVRSKKSCRCRLYTGLKLNVWFYCCLFKI